MARYDDPSVLCPFYCEENRYAVICEGPSDHMKVHLCFSPTSKKKEHKVCYCMGDYQKCELAKTLYRVWEEKDASLGKRR